MNKQIKRLQELAGIEEAPQFGGSTKFIKNVGELLAFIKENNVDTTTRVKGVAIIERGRNSSTSMFTTVEVELDGGLLVFRNEGEETDDKRLQELAGISNEGSKQSEFKMKPGTGTVDLGDLDYVGINIIKYLDKCLKQKGQDFASDVSWELLENINAWLDDNG